MGIQLAPIEGTPYAGGTATGVIYLDANGLQRSDGPTVGSTGIVTFPGDPLISFGKVTLSTNGTASTLTGLTPTAYLIGLRSGIHAISSGTYARTSMTDTGEFRMRDTGRLLWTDASSSMNTPDTSLSRISAGVTGVGTGTQGSVAGTLSAGILTATAQAITDTPLEVNGAVGQTADIATFGTGARVTAAEEFSNNGSETGSESFGAGAVATGSYATLIGNNTTGAAYTVAGGYNTRAAENSVVFGHYGGQFGFHSACVLFGQSASSTTTNQFVAGSQYARIDNVYFGEGVSNATPTAYTINGTGGSGTDIAGADINIAGGIGRGTGAGGDIVFKTAAAGSTGSTANTLTTAMTIDASQNVTADNYRVGSPLGGYYDNTGVYGLETKTDGDIRIKNNTDARLQLAGGRFGTWHLGSQGVFGWSNGNVFGTVDTALSRISAGVIGVGTGSLGSVAGTLSAGILTATAPAITDTPLAVNGSVGQTADLILANDGSNDVFAVAQNGDVDLDRTGDTAGPSVQLSHWSSKTAKRSTVDFRKSGSNTKGGNTTLSDSTQMGDIFWWGNDGNGFHESARIYGLSAGTANNNTPGKIRFATTPSGAYTAADRMEIDESGLVSVYDDLAITSPTVPASASATGVAGTVSWDADYIYICTATDTWKRVAISTW